MSSKNFQFWSQTMQNLDGDQRRAAWSVAEQLATNVKPSRDLMSRVAYDLIDEVGSKQFRDAVMSAVIADNRLGHKSAGVNFLNPSQSTAAVGHHWQKILTTINNRIDTEIKKPLLYLAVMHMIPHEFVSFSTLYRKTDQDRSADIFRRPHVDEDEIEQMCARISDRGLNLTQVFFGDPEEDDEHRNASDHYDLRGLFACLRAFEARVGRDESSSSSEEQNQVPPKDKGELEEVDVEIEIEAGKRDRDEDDDLDLFDDESDKTVDNRVKKKAKLIEISDEEDGSVRKQPRRAAKRVLTYDERMTRKEQNYREYDQMEQEDDEDSESSSESESSSD
jgi:hypothetical protein